MTDHGHCQHEADGTPFQRHEGRPRALVAVKCCHCGTTGSVQGHAPHVVAKAWKPYLKAEHGRFHPLYTEDT